MGNIIEQEHKDRVDKGLEFSDKTDSRAGLFLAAFLGEHKHPQYFLLIELLLDLSQFQVSGAVEYFLCEDGTIRR